MNRKLPGVGVASIERMDGVLFCVTMAFEEDFIDAVCSHFSSKGLRMLIEADTARAAWAIYLRGVHATHLKIAVPRMP